MSDDTKTKLEDLKEKIEELQDKIEDIGEKIGDLNKQRSRWDIYDEDLEVKLENLEDERDALRRDLRKKRRRYREAARKIRKTVRNHKPKFKKGVKFNLEGLEDLGEGIEDLGNVFSEYFSSFVDSIGKSLEGALGEVFFPGTRKQRRPRRGEWEIPASQLDTFCEKGSEILMALADKRRLMLLKLLELSPRYQKDLSERASIAGGAFKHHVTTLKEYKMVVQEEVRGRYLITPFGRQALKLAEMLFLQSHHGRKIRSKREDIFEIEDEEVEEGAEETSEATTEVLDSDESDEEDLAEES
ncbi:MAG: hypothetical protein ACFFBD_10490 [Candidatus Hodarchaeota archaeon]